MHFLQKNCAKLTLKFPTFDLELTPRRKCPLSHSRASLNIAVALETHIFGVFGIYLVYVGDHGFLSQDAAEPN